MRTAWVVAIFVVLVIVAAGASAVYFVSGSRRVDHAVAAVRGDLAKVDSDSRQFPSPAALPTFPNFAAATSPDALFGLAGAYDAAADKYSHLLDQTDNLISDERSRLDDAQHLLNAVEADWLTLPGRSRLQKEHNAVGLALEAAADQEQLVLVSRKQIGAAKTIVDGLSIDAEVVNRIADQDYTAANTDVGPAQGQLKDAAVFADGAHLPPGWATVVTVSTKLTNDLGATVQDLQSGNSSAAERDSAAVSADGKALMSIDRASLRPTSYLSDLASKIAKLIAEARTAA